MAEAKQGLSEAKRIAVLGAGSWGTALAHHLKRAGHEVLLWGRDASTLKSISEHRVNPRYFPNHVLCQGIRGEAELAAAVTGAELLVVALPSSTFRAIGQQLRGMLARTVVVVSAAKGVEEGNWKRLSQVLSEELGASERVGVLSGPTFARELLDGLPTAVTLCFADIERARAAAKVFHFDNFRVYTSDDLIGVELGGVVKNVMALAAGIVDGLGMGTNARAALITRGLAEMRRIVIACGGQAETVMGLSGLGDLFLTCTGDLSRNRRVGLLLGQGKSLDEAMQTVGQVAEGVTTATRVLSLAADCGVSAPIVEVVTQVLNGQITAKSAVKALLSRSQKEE